MRDEREEGMEGGKGRKNREKNSRYVTHLKEQATDSNHHMKTNPVPSWEGRGLMSISTNQQAR